MTFDGDERRANAWIALGGNVGDVEAAFRAALTEIEASLRCEIVAVSSLWRTPPWGKTDQPDFLNACTAIATDLAPVDLLALLNNIEAAGQRRRTERWGPRTLDLDIICYEDMRLETDQLTLPHPRAHERAFVLDPLAEIAPELDFGHGPVGRLAAEIDRSGMVRAGKIAWR